MRWQWRTHGRTHGGAARPRDRSRLRVTHLKTIIKAHTPSVPILMLFWERVEDRCVLKREKIVLGIEDAYILEWTVRKYTEDFSIN
jgi:hypothetical protein